MSDKNSSSEEPQSVKILPRIKVDYGHSIYKNDQSKSFTGNDLPNGEEIPEDQKPIVKKLYEDILLCFAVDKGDRYEILQNEIFAKNPDLNIDTLHQVSVNALVHEIGENIELKGNPDDILMVTAGGNFEAAIILINNFWDQIHEMFNGNAVVAIPAKDLLFICKEENQAAIEKLKGIIQGYFEKPETDGLLSKALYLREKGQTELKLL